jgi:hypothetical protein
VSRAEKFRKAAEHARAAIQLLQDAKVHPSEYVLRELMENARTMDTWATVEEILQSASITE